MSNHTAYSVAHFDVAGPDLGPLAPFYAQVFGWKVRTPEGSADGALVEQPDAAITLGIVVPSLAESLRQACAAGGSLAMPATDNGWVRKAQVRDPAGNLLTLIESDGP